MQSAEAKLYSNSNWPVNKKPKPIGMSDEKKKMTMICPVMACWLLWGGFLLSNRKWYVHYTGCSIIWSIQINISKCYDNGTIQSFSLEMAQHCIFFSDNDTDTHPISIPIWNFFLKKNYQLLIWFFYWSRIYLFS